jgi:hypothetical protein
MYWEEWKCFGLVTLVGGIARVRIESERYLTPTTSSNTFDAEIWPANHREVPCMKHSDLETNAE